jgi:hypothetical protein
MKGSRLAVGCTKGEHSAEAKRGNESGNKGVGAIVKTSNREYNVRYFFSVLTLCVWLKKKDFERFYAVQSITKLYKHEYIFCCYHINDNVKLVQG